MNHMGYNAKEQERIINQCLSAVFSSENLRDLFQQNSRKGPTRLYVNPFLYFDELNSLLIASSLADSIDRLRMHTELHFFAPTSSSVKRERVDSFNRGNDITFEFGDRHNEYYYHFPKGTLVMSIDKRTTEERNTKLLQRQADQSRTDIETEHNKESFSRKITAHPLDASEMVTDITSIMNAIEDGQRQLLKEMAEQLKMCIANGMSIAEFKIDMSISSLTRK
jgi:hypothetical protein